MVQKKSKNIKKIKKASGLALLGKNIRTVSNLAKQAKITVKQATAFAKESGDRYIYKQSTGQIVKINIKDDIKSIKNNNDSLLLKSWGIKQIPKNKFIKANQNIKGDFFILKNLNQLAKRNANVKLTIAIQMAFDVSDEFVERYQRVFFNGNINDIEDYVENFIKNYVSSFGLFIVGLDKLIKYTKKDFIKGVNKTQFNARIESDLNSDIKFDIKNHKMRKVSPLDIHTNLFNHTIKIDNNGHCVKDYLKACYPKIMKTKIGVKRIDELGDEEGVDSNELIEFSKLYDIKTLIYDIEGNIINSYYPKKKNRIYKNIIGICYDNHLYPVNHKYLNKKNIIESTVYDNDINESFKKLVTEDKVIPSNILLSSNNTSKLNILSYVHNKINYYNNPEYEKCLNILDKFGLKDKISPFTTLKNIGFILQKAYLQNNTTSFFPVKYIKGGYNYINRDLVEEDNYKTIDHNKFYSNCLKDLKFLIKTDYRQALITSFESNPDTICPFYLYVVEPVIPCILIPNINIYSGEHVLYCLNAGVEMIIKEEIQAESVQNDYSKLVDDLYNKIDHSDAKMIMNILIGKFECEINVNTNIKVSKVCGLNERLTDDNMNYIKYDDNLYLKVDGNTSIKNFNNCKPISIQVKDLSRIKLYEKMISMKITSKNLICIETDSITWVDNGEFKKISKSLDKNDYTKWKEIKKDYDWFLNRSMCEPIKNNESFILEKSDKNILNNCYAGAGKTYDIINNLIPKLGTDYLIVTPSHNSAKQYYKLGLNCKVIQTFEYNDYLIPEQKNIIIDEIGLCGRAGNDFIYKMSFIGKNIYSYGDFKQLLPVGELTPFNSKNYLEHLYKTINEVSTNYRNNFTKEYYDELINSKDKKWLVEQIKKYRLEDYTKAEIILCKTNNEIKYYNDLMAKYLKVEFGDAGSKIICNTNNLRDKEIYNNFDFIIDDIIEDEDDDDDVYVLDDETKITEKELNKNFQLGYAITCHKAQGQQFKSYYIPDSSLDYVDGRFAYTVISRLIGNVSKI